jgi:hypothetical protein
MVYLITYDLKSPGAEYPQLFEAIKNFKTWLHHLDSTWLIQCELTADQVFERLRPHLRKGDKLLVIAVRRSYQGLLNERAWEWLKARNF